MYWLKVYSYYGLYPISTWFMSIHCENCRYEGKTGTNWYKYSFFIVATIFVLIVFSFNGITLSRSILNSRRLVSSSLYLYLAYIVYFFRPQKYYCPCCKGDQGIPLKFYQYIKR